MHNSQIQIGLAGRRVGTLRARYDATERGHGRRVLRMLISGKWVYISCVEPLLSKLENGVQREEMGQNAEVRIGFGCCPLFKEEEKELLEPNNRKT